MVSPIILVSLAGSLMITTSILIFLEVIIASTLGSLVVSLICWFGKGLELAFTLLLSNLEAFVHTNLDKVSRQGFFKLTNLRAEPC